MLIDHVPRINFAAVMLVVLFLWSLSFLHRDASTVDIFCGLGSMLSDELVPHRRSQYPEDGRRILQKSDQYVKITHH